MTRWLWLAWVAVVAALTGKILVWHVEYFKSPGPQFYKIALGFVPVLALSVFLYAWLRRKAVWRFEPLAFATLASAASLFYEPRAFLVSLALFFAAYALGAWAGDALRLNLSGPLNRILIRCGFGFGLLIPLCFVLGEFRLLYPGVILTILLILAALGMRGALRDLLALHEIWKSAGEVRHPIAGVAVAFGFVAMICTLMTALSPPINFDTLQMHLPSVEHYVETRSIAPFPEIEYSYYPQGGETLWTAAYALAGGPGTQVESAMFFVLFLLVVFRLARECASGRAAALAGTIWAATLPFLHWTGSVMKNDMIMTFFQGLALLAFLKWLRERGFSWILAGAFFLAQSFGVKYVALFGAIPLAIFFAFAVWKQPRRWNATLAVIAVFLCFGTFWTVRTYVLTGNPVYPEVADRVVNGAIGAHHYSAAFKLLRYVTLPWKIIFDGGRVFESPLPNPSGIILFAFFPLLFFASPKWRNPGILTCVAFVLIYCGYWAAMLGTLRYAIVPFAIAAMLLAQGAARFYDSASSRPIRLSIVAVEVYCLLIAALGTMIIEVNGPQFNYFAGRLDRPGYLRAALRTYASLEDLKRVVRPGESILGIDNCSRAYAPEPLRYQCLLCAPDGCDAKAVDDGLKKFDPRYLIVPEQNAPPEAVIELHRRPWTRIHHDPFFSVYHAD
ncbi:MAG: glycosyltransferase family 39 protein [Acidobacteriia bacterium]|nr:glycosyltransferase family 39 protein [Terriglobia bacterium]